jgi:hypothetical protein
MFEYYLVFYVEKVNLLYEFVGFVELGLELGTFVKIANLMYLFSMDENL